MSRLIDLYTLSWVSALAHADKKHCSSASPQSAPKRARSEKAAQGSFFPPPGAGHAHPTKRDRITKSKVSTNRCAQTDTLSWRIAACATVTESQLRQFNGVARCLDLRSRGQHQTCSEHLNSKKEIFTTSLNGKNTCITSRLVRVILAQGPC